MTRKWLAKYSRWLRRHLNTIRVGSNKFINAFRLKTFIASRTRLFDAPEPGSGYRQLTTYQLGKFVAIGLRWPLLLADLDNHRQLLKGLEEIVFEKLPVDKVLKDDQDADPTLTEALERWRNRPGLRALLKFGCYTDGQFDPKKGGPYALQNINVNKLLQVSPESINRRPTGSPGVNSNKAA